LRVLRPTELDYLRVRLTTDTDVEACAQLQLSPNTMKQWRNKPLIDEAVRLSRADGVVLAVEILRRGAASAASLLVREVDGRGSMGRIKAAAEVLDRLGVKGTQLVDITSKGEALGSGLGDVIARKLDSIAASRRETGVHSEPDSG
jgi:hypothetical protein